MMISQRRTINILAALCLLFIIFQLKTNSVQAMPQDFFVSPNGSGSACSQAQPCHLNTALTASSNSDNIYLAGGRYYSASGPVIHLTKNINFYGGWDGTTAIPIITNPKVYITVLDGENNDRVITTTTYRYPLFEDLHITNGSVTANGGCVYIDEGSNVTFKNCDVYNCSGLHGAGIYFNHSGGAINDSVIHNNIATNNGGGVAAIVSNSLTVQGTEFTDNEAFWGGGVIFYQSTGFLYNNTFTSNRATESGGAVSIDQGVSTTVSNNDFYNNEAQFGGGLLAGTGFVNLNNNQFSGNEALWGGALYFIDSNVNLNNTMVVNNKVLTNGRGSGLYIRGAIVNLKHSTFAWNTGGDGTGIYITSFSTPSNVDMKNTILVKHGTGVLVEPGHTLNMEATLWGKNYWANGTNTSGTVTTGSINIYEKPGFVAPSLGNYHILPASAAVNAGIDAGLPFDIDYQLRPLGGGFDIGADELDYFAFLPIVMR